MRRPRGRAGRPKQTCVVAAPGLEPGLPKAGMQILSLPEAVLPKFLCGHRFRPKSQEVPVTQAEIH